jgi:hypothetical protein
MECFFQFHYDDKNPMELLEDNMELHTNNNQYTSVEQIDIHLEGGFIYNTSDNTWTEHFQISKFLIFTFPFERNYYVKTPNKELLTGKITGTYKPTWQKKCDSVEIEDTIQTLPYLINERTNTKETNNLYPYLFFQRYLEIIFKSKNIDYKKVQKLDNDITEFMKIYGDEPDSKLVKCLLSNIISQ